MNSSTTMKRKTKTAVPVARKKTVQPTYVKPTHTTLFKSVIFIQMILLVAAGVALISGAGDGFLWWTRSKVATVIPDVPNTVPDTTAPETTTSEIPTVDQPIVVVVQQPSAPTTNITLFGVASGVIFLLAAGIIFFYFAARRWYGDAMNNNKELSSSQHGRAIRFARRLDYWVELIAELSPAFVFLLFAVIFYSIGIPFVGEASLLAALMAALMVVASRWWRGVSLWKRTKETASAAVPEVVSNTVKSVIETSQNLATSVRERINEAFEQTEEQKEARKNKEDDLQTQKDKNDEIAEQQGEATGWWALLPYGKELQHAFEPEHGGNSNEDYDF